jgi:hypothetical protein
MSKGGTPVSTTTSPQPLDVVQGHVQTLGQDNLDVIMKDYSEDSVLFTPGGLLRGPNEIGAYWGEFLKTRPPDFLQASKILRQDATGEVVYLTWTAEPYIKWAAETFIVRNGKIEVQTIGTYLATA